MRTPQKLDATRPPQGPIVAAHLEIESLVQLERLHELGEHLTLVQLRGVVATLLTWVPRTAHTACHALRRRVKTRRRAQMRPGCKVGEGVPEITDYPANPVNLTTASARPEPNSLCIDFQP